MFHLHEDTDGDKYYTCQDCGLTISWHETFRIRYWRLKSHVCDPDLIDPL